MKNKFLKSAALFLVSGLLCGQLLAQTTPASPGSSVTTTPEKVQPQKSPSVTHREESKEQWLNRYNAIKPKLDGMASNAKMDAKNAEFTAELNKLSRMAAAYKAQIDNWDKNPADKREGYVAGLRASNKELNQQYFKVKSIWDKTHPASENNNGENAPARK